MADAFDKILEGLEEAARVAGGEDIGQRTYRADGTGGWFAAQYGVEAWGDTVADASRALDEAIAARAEADTEG